MLSYRLKLTIKKLLVDFTKFLAVQGLAGQLHSAAGEARDHVRQAHSRLQAPGHRGPDELAQGQHHGDHDLLIVDALRRG